MRSIVILELDAVEGALVRTLGMVTRRGHDVVGLWGQRTGSAGERLHLVLTVESDRPVALLLRQLLRLEDVRVAAELGNTGTGTLGGTPP